MRMSEITGLVRHQAVIEAERDTIKRAARLAEDEHVAQSMGQAPAFLEEGTLPFPSTSARWISSHWRPHVEKLFQAIATHLSSQRELTGRVSGSFIPISQSARYLPLHHLLGPTWQQRTKKNSLFVTEDWLAIRISQSNQESYGRQSRAMSLIVLTRECVYHSMTLMTLRKTVLKSPRAELAIQEFQEKHEKQVLFQRQGILGDRCAIGQLHWINCWNEQTHTYNKQCRPGYLVHQALCNAYDLGAIIEAAIPRCPMLETVGESGACAIKLYIAIEEHLRMAKILQKLFINGYSAWDMSSGNFMVEPSHFCDTETITADDELGPTGQRTLIFTPLWYLLELRQHEHAEAQPSSLVRGISGHGRSSDSLGYRSCWDFTLDDVAGLTNEAADATPYGRRLNEPCLVMEWPLKIPGYRLSDRCYPTTQRHLIEIHSLGVLGGLCLWLKARGISRAPYIAKFNRLIDSPLMIDEKPGYGEPLSAETSSRTPLPSQANGSASHHPVANLMTGGDTRAGKSTSSVPSHTLQPAPTFAHEYTSWWGSILDAVRNPQGLSDPMQKIALEYGLLLERMTAPYNSQCGRLIDQMRMTEPCHIRRSFLPDKRLGPQVPEISIDMVVQGLEELLDQFPDVDDPSLTTYSSPEAESDLLLGMHDVFGADWKNFLKEVRSRNLQK